LILTRVGASVQAGALACQSHRVRDPPHENLIADRLEDLTPLLERLAMASRNFH
jgi:hypothetical protein